MVDFKKMKENNLIVDESYAFALEVMRISKLMRDRKEHDLASQFWRAGTSIGANVEEAQAAQSRADFRSKMYIASKEARETHYWPRLTKDGEVLPPTETLPALEQIERIIRILTSIVKSST
jgi:four helix bundle protein